MDKLACLFALLLLPFFGLLGAILTAVFFRRLRVTKGCHLEQGSWPFMFFLVPAHNEEKGIQTTIQSLLAQDYPQDRFKVVVVADNCTDRTADLARGAGADVIERNDSQRRGKGYALEFALDLLQASPVPWEGVVIIDADSVLDVGAMRIFATNLVQGWDWQQGYYTVSNADESWRTRLVTVALALFNGIWPAGADTLGLGSPLRGNGMAFSRSGLTRIDAAAHGLTEDLELSWRLRLAGEHVHFVPQAIVRGAMVARTGKSATDQRLRWERGRSALRKQFRGPIWSAPTYSLWGRILATTDLYFPPISALISYFLLSTVLAVAAASKAGTVLVSAYGAIFILYLLAPFLLMRLPWGYLKALIYAPVYMAWKFCLAFSPEPRQWVRTVRD